MAGASKLFEVMVGLNHSTAVFIGRIVFLTNTFLGGFLTVCWTDLFQGLRMVFSILIVALIAHSGVGGFNAVEAVSKTKGIAMFPEVPGGDAETVFIHMISQLFNTWFGEILLASIPSAIMSIIDSQLLPSSRSAGRQRKNSYEPRP